MPACTCHGRNPDCFKCGGWGWVGDSIGESRAPYSEVSFQPKNRKNKKRRKRSPANIQCPYCPKKVRNLTHHVSMSHYDKWNEFSNISYVKELLKNKKRCGLCGTILNEKNYEKHIYKQHKVLGIDSKNNLIKKKEFF